MGGGQHFSEEVTRERNAEECVGVCQAEGGGSTAGSRKQPAQRPARGWRKGKGAAGDGEEKFRVARAQREGG